MDKPDGSTLISSLLSWSARIVLELPGEALRGGGAASQGRGRENRWRKNVAEVLSSRGAALGGKESSRQRIVCVDDDLDLKFETPPQQAVAQYYPPCPWRYLVGRWVGRYNR